MNSFIFGVVATIAVLSIACFLLLPWVRRFGKGENKKISLVFMSLIIACAVLWLVCVYMFIGIYNKSKVDGFDAKSLVTPLNFVKATLIISMQFLMASLVAETVIRYRKKMIVFQAITYLSNLFFDFYITFFLGCLSITSKGMALSSKAKILGNKFMVVMFVISILYMAISSAIMKKQEAKRFTLAVQDNYDIDGQKRSKDQKTEEVQPVVQSPEEKLESLKNMLDKNLITQEEYDKKREEILKDM
ncbi:MAG: SHOCT domain-containing protein [Clostridia bacterium]|nr:SHOCT domain-containing protein [Clostridia bacterium]